MAIAIEQEPKAGGALEAKVVRGKPLRALQRLGALRLSRFRGARIAVLGFGAGPGLARDLSRGLEPLLATAFLEGGSEEDLALSLLEIESRVQVVVAEAHGGAPGRLAREMAYFRGGILLVTGLSVPGAASDPLSAREEERRLKDLREACRLLGEDGTLILNVDDPLLARFRLRKGPKILTFGVERGAIRPQRPQVDGFGRVSFRIGRTAFRLPLPGLHHLYRALAVFAVGERLRLSKTALARTLSAAPRLAEGQGLLRIGRVTVTAECRDPDPQALRSALLALGHQRQAGRRIAVVGDLSRESAFAAERGLGRLLIEAGIGEVLTFGLDSRALNRECREAGLPFRKVRHYTRLDLLCEDLCLLVRDGDAVLVAGGPDSRLHEAAALLETVLKGRQMEVGSRPA